MLWPHNGSLEEACLEIETYFDSLVDSYDGRYGNAMWVGRELACMECIDVLCPGMLEYFNNGREVEGDTP